MPDSLTPRPSSGWLSNPENKVTLTGTLVPMLLVGIIWAVISFLGGSPGDMISHAFDNLQHIIFSAIASFALLAIATDETARKLITYVYRGVMRKITGGFADIDPIGIRETYVEEREKDLVVFETGIRNLRAQSIKNKTEMNNNTAELKKTYDLAKQAKAASNVPMLTVYGTHIAELEGLAKDYQSSQDRLDTIMAIVTKQRELCNTRIMVLRNDITTRKKRMALNNATNSIIGGAKAILKGVPVETNMYNMAGEVLDMQDATSAANFGDYIDATRELMATADLQAGANLQAVLDKLNALEAPPEQKQIPAAVTPAQSKTTSAGTSADPGADSGYDDLFK